MLTIKFSWPKMHLWFSQRYKIIKISVFKSQLACHFFFLFSDVILKEKMYPDIFTEEEKEAMKSCISAIKSLPLYTSPDFENAFGLSNKEVEEVLGNYPNWDLHDESANGNDDSWLAINNSFGFLLNGSNVEKNEMIKSVSFSKDFLNQLYVKFKNI